EGEAILTDLRKGSWRGRLEGDEGRRRRGKQQGKETVRPGAEKSVDTKTGGGRGARYLKAKSRQRTTP
ncbi:unnamed protein product, partial [Musa textilis]